MITANKTESPHNNSLSIAGLILLLVPISIWALWIGIFSSNPSASQPDKLKLFLSYFPTFLRRSSSVGLIVLASTAGSILLTALGRKSATRIVKIVGICVIIVASLVLLLQLFSML
jgi:hypothetical protein